MDSKKINLEDYNDLKAFVFKQQVTAAKNDKLIDLAEGMTLDKWECSYLIDLSRNEIREPRGFDSFLGYKDNEIHPDLLIEGIHPEDVQLMGTLVKGSVKYVRSHPEVASRLILRIAYRRKHKKGHYVYVLSESYVRTFNEKGHVLTAFTRNLDISFFGLDLPVQWSFVVDGKEEPEFLERVFGENKAMFTDRELEVIQCIKKGLRNKEIADELNISEHTVATHRKRILSKSGTHCPEELIAFCRLHGI